MISIPPQPEPSVTPGLSRAIQTKEFAVLSWSPFVYPAGTQSSRRSAPELELEFARHHADHIIIIAINPPRTCQQRGIATIPPLPQP